jgi:hypothetical protein
MKTHLSQKPVMTVHRRILKKDKLVYLLVGPKPVRYQDGKSRIVYIGTTSRGAGRIASSAAHRAEEILETRGFRLMDVHVVSCKSRPGLKSWRYLEQALLAEFRTYYQELPRCNKQGKKLRWNDKLDRFFRRKAIDKILTQFDASR